MKQRKRDPEQTLGVAGQIFQHIGCTLCKADHLSRQNIHVITNTNGFFLFVDFAALDIRQLPLYILEGFHMIEGLNMHSDDLSGLHPQQIHQQTFIQFRSQNAQKADTRYFSADHKPIAVVEVETARCNEVLGG